MSINSAGEIVDISAYQPRYEPALPAKVVGCVLRNGVWIDPIRWFPQILKPSSLAPFPSTTAGQILCNTKTANGTSYKPAVLLTPNN
ncbi:MAG TPA: hypothetical protein VGV18_04955 [Verrucomicrobiae bacterium]|nr:hypothetical protein [Verrucomicrobiae bacterium]